MPSEGMFIDLVLNGAQREEAAVNISACGSTRPKAPRCPFMLNSNGQLDYGAGYEDEDQYYDTNLLEAAFSRRARR